MNKILLTLAAAAAMSMSVSAAENVIFSAYDGNGGTLGGWDNSERDNKAVFDSNAKEDGKDCLKFTNTEALTADTWKCQLGLSGLELVEGTTYYMSFDVKGTPATGLVFNMQSPDNGYAGRGDFEPFNVTESWNKVTVKGTCNGDATTQMTCTLGGYAGTLYITDFKLYTVEEGGDTPEQPEQPEQPAGIVNSWYTGNGQILGGWGGATFENVDEDGKPCLKVSNAEAKTNEWDIQIGIDADGLENGKTYYLSFDVKGTPAEGVTTGIQDTSDYSGKGNFTTFNITEAWAKAVISATVNGENANRICINLGHYVGTFFMTNVVLSTTDPAGVDAVEMAPVVNHWTVYNLMGVKVLDTDNEAAVNELANGIYVINGKKVAIRK